MENTKEQLEDACNDYFIKEFTEDTNEIGFMYGDRNYISSKTKSESEFYRMIVNDLIKIIDKKLFISRWGAFAEGDEIQIVNPDLFLGGNQEYFVKAKLIIHNDEWLLDYNNKTYNFDDVSVVIFR